jgi:excinuclease ABC subunit C
MTDEPEPQPDEIAEAAAEVAADSSRPTGVRRAAAKVREFPQTPGVYLMKDAAGRVIYVGKAKNLRARAGSYFLKAAAEDRRTADLVREIADIDFLDADSEVDALLAEARLIKDVQPKFNQDLKDDKTFPYLEITTREDYPRVEFTREPRTSGSKLYGPFASAGSLRGAMQVLQKIFKFRTCTLVPALPVGLDRSMFGPVQSAHLQGRLPPRRPAPADVPGRQQKETDQGNARGNDGRGSGKTL